MSELSEMYIESLRVRARRAKAMAMEKHKVGDLVGAKKYAVKAKKLNPYLNGLVRLNAVLDVLLGFEQKIDGAVDWYAVLAIDLTADVETIQISNRKLLLFIVMDDSDDSVCSVDEAKRILAECWRSFCDEDSKKLYDKQRQERVDNVKQQQLKRASLAGRSFTSNPVILSAPNPPHRVSEDNEGMVHPPVRMSGQVPIPTVTPVILSALNPPESAYKENDQMVQPQVRVSGQAPMSTVFPVTFSAPNPPQRSGKEVERRVHPPVGVYGQVSMSTVTPVTLSMPNSQKSVNKENDQMVQPQVRVSGQVPMSTVTPANFSAPNPPQRAGKEIERMVHPSVGVSRQVPMSTVTPVKLSAPSPPQRVGKEKEGMVPPPVRDSDKVPFFTSNPDILLAFNPPQRVSEENKPQVIVSGKIPLFTITPVVLSPSQRPKMSASFKNLEGVVEVQDGKHDQLPSRIISVENFRRATQVPRLSAQPVVKSPRLKTFDEENEELFEVQIPLPISSPPRRGSEGESKRKAPTHMLHANKLRRINEDAGISTIERGGDNAIPRAIKSSLQRFLSARQKLNAASSSAAVPPQESKKCNSPNSVNIESTNQLVTVQWNKGVYPKEGEVWAMYENWSPSWGSSTPKQVNKYEMVQVLEDFDEVRGVTVAPLVKLPGFKAVYRRLPVPKTFLKEQLVSFSHQVASRLFIGQAGKNAPKGCLELDSSSSVTGSSQGLYFTEEELKNLKNQKQVSETMNKEANVPVYKIKQEKMD